MKTFRRYLQPTPVRVDGVHFASKAEGFRYVQLLALAGLGLIDRLEVQPRYPLDVVRPADGLVTRVGTYVADFRYIDAQGRTVIEDVKGMATTIYRLKKRMVEALYGIQVIEVEARAPRAPRPKGGRHARRRR